MNLFYVQSPFSCLDSVGTKYPVLKPLVRLYKKIPGYKLDWPQEDPDIHALACHLMHVIVRDSFGMKLPRSCSVTTKTVSSERVEHAYTLFQHVSFLFLMERTLLADSKYPFQSMEGVLYFYMTYARPKHLFGL